MGCVVNMRRLLYRQEERPLIHCTGDWVGLAAGRNGYGKSRPTRGSTVTPDASRYTATHSQVYIKEVFYRKLTADPINGCNPEGATKCYTSSHFHDFVLTSAKHKHF